MHMTYTATVTSQGQITIPVEIRRKLKLDKKIIYRFDPEGWSAPTIGPHDRLVVRKNLWRDWSESAVVQLVNNDGQLTDETHYRSAKTGLSWVRFDEEWQWSTLATPGRTNEVMVPAVAVIPSLPKADEGSNKMNKPQHQSSNFDPSLPPLKKGRNFFSPLARD